MRGVSRHLGTRRRPAGREHEEPSPDLTQFAARNGGTFPSAVVAQIIDGRQPVKGDGGPDMPVWGDAFRASRNGSSEEAVQARIKALLNTSSGCRNAARNSPRGSREFDPSPSSVFHLYTGTRRMVPRDAEEVSMAAAYSMDLRARVLQRCRTRAVVEGAGRTVSRESRVGGCAEAAAAGDRGDRPADSRPSFGGACLAGQEERLVALITARPDATLAELRDALPTTAGLTTLWRDDRALGLHRQKKRYTPTSNAGLMSRRRAASGAPGSRCATCGSTSSSMNAA